MTDTRTETDRLDCPESFCIQAFRPQEMQAHLEWDHGYSEYKAEQLVQEVVEQ